MCVQWKYGNLTFCTKEFTSSHFAIKVWQFSVSLLLKNYLSFKKFYFLMKIFFFFSFLILPGAFTTI